MFKKHSLLLAVGGSALAAAAPSLQRSSQTPCARISEQYVQGLKNGEVSSFSSDLVLECLQSMPFEPRRAASFVEDVKKYVQWQSNVDTLSDPPLSYEGRPVDIWGGLDDIQQRAKENKFVSQFEFDTALSDLFRSVNDGHFSILPCSYMPFSFVNPEKLVSVSSDGLEIPEIYTFTNLDADDAQVFKNNSAAVSPVVTINGEDASTYLQSLAGSQSFQDPDASYNNFMYSHARYTSSSQMLGAFSYPLNGAYPGTTEYTLIYANGTMSKSKVKAVAQDEFIYANGTELYEDYCLPVPEESTSASATPTPTPSTSTPAAASSSTPATSPTATVLPAPTGYPKAVVRDENNLVAGYLLNKPDLQDAAVLSVPTFSVSGVEGGTSNISSLVINFLEKSVNAGRKKIILDLTSNPGGNTNYAFDLFKIFFPNKTPYWSTRLRAHKALYYLEKMGYSVPQDPENETWATLADMGLFGLKTPNQNYTYKSEDEVYGPHDVLGANMTSPTSFNFNVISSDRMPIHGYGGIKPNWTQPLFAPEDILIVTDGSCSSSCPIFTKMMKYEGVRTISFGGRPQPGPMQAMGGTRGGQVLPGDQLVLIMGAALEIAAEKEILDENELKQLKALSPAETSPLQYGSLQVNLRDAYGKEDEESEMPLQYVYEPAHCRLFYTLENVLEPATVWSAAARAIWGDGECVAGSRNQL
ncbi:peptidase S41 family protein [Aspergillus undulatus]|uniref:peptidase S41 family protein n=1 Tax=Aspergillus undulatus TaxID=1810928 RepID=UPI003CCE4D09